MGEIEVLDDDWAWAGQEVREGLKDRGFQDPNISEYHNFPFHFYGYVF